MIDRIYLLCRKEESLFPYDRSYLTFHIAVASARYCSSLLEYTHNPLISFILETIYARTMIEEP